MKKVYQIRFKVYYEEVDEWVTRIYKYLFSNIKDANDFADTLEEKILNNDKEFLTITNVKEIKISELNVIENLEQIENERKF